MSKRNQERICKAVLSVSEMHVFLAMPGFSTAIKGGLIFGLLCALAGAAQEQQVADVRTFGKCAALSKTTAATTSGEPTVLLNEVQSFRNGEYVTIFHAGPPRRLTRPSAPIVTPSVNAGGVDTITPRARSSEFACEIVAADKFGCYTTVSMPGSTSAGNRLGQQTIAITSGTRSNNLQRVTTSTAHGLMAGQMVYIRVLQH